MRFLLGPLGRHGLREKRRLSDETTTRIRLEGVGRWIGEIALLGDAGVAAIQYGTLRFPGTDLFGWDAAHAG